MEPVQSVEATGETVEDAVQTGLGQLGVGPNDVLVEVLDEPSRGVFGIGAKPARVRLKLLRPPEPVPEPVATVDDASDDSETDADEGEGEAVGDDGDVARKVLQELLEKMDLAGEVEVSRAEPSQPGESTPWLLNVEGDDLNMLIGRRGETLAAL